MCKSKNDKRLLLSREMITFALKAMAMTEVKVLVKAMAMAEVEAKVEHEAEAEVEVKG